MRQPGGREPGAERIKLLQRALGIMAAVGAAFAVINFARAPSEKLFLGDALAAVIVGGGALLAGRVRPARAMWVVGAAMSLTLAAVAVSNARTRTGPDAFLPLVAAPLLLSILFPSEPAIVTATSLVATASVFATTRSFGLPAGQVAYWTVQVAAFSAYAVFASRRHARLIATLSGEADHRTARLAQALASASDDWFHLRDERAVLASAVDALCAQGFTAQIVSAEGDDLRLSVARFGADLAPAAGIAEGMLLPASLGRAFIDAFATRAATFHDDLHAIAGASYPPDAARAVRAAISTRGTIAPIFVGEVPRACLAVQGDSLSEASGAAIGLFARKIGAALENVGHHREAVLRLEQVGRLQREVVDRERLAALGEAAAVISHEVRNPLGVILNATSILKRAGRGSPEEGGLLEMVEEESLRIDRLVRDLLILARPLRSEPRPTDVNVLLARCVRVAQGGGAEAPDAAVVVSATGATHIDADPDHLQMALVNLIRNALQACPRGQSVRVSADARPEGTRLVVEDPGPGIPPEDMARLFEPFFTTRATGTGLGLAIVKRVAEAHGGSVRAENAPGGGGARFEITIPHKPAPLLRARASAAGPSPAAS